MSARRLGLVLLAIGLVAACRPALSEEECNLLLDHYADKQIDQARPSTGPGQRAKLIEDVRVRAAADPAFAECKSEVSRPKYDCAMLAVTADGIERCVL